MYRPVKPCCDGARGRTRTVMLSPTADFESAASTDFATRAGVQVEMSGDYNNGFA